MVRIDMSEFMEKHAVARLIGAPPGYVGYEEGGVLTEAVRRRPYQVVLFDEVEKAHGDVFNVLLQVLDDGRLTDGQGRTVDFTNTIIILTSNLGSQYLAALGEDEAVEKVEPQVMEVVRGHFRPEFLNRLDEIILFHRLSAGHMGPIVDIQVARLQKLLEDRKIRLELTDAARAWLGRVGYDPVYGARPLKRAVQKYLQDPLADKILAGEDRRRSDGPGRRGRRAAGADPGRGRRGVRHGGMTTSPVPLVLQAIEALKRGDRRGGAALLQQDLRQGSPSPDRCRTISRLAAEIGEIDMAIEASRRSLSPPTLDKLLAHWALLATYGRADEAMAEIGRLDPTLRDHPAVLHFRGTIASEEGRFGEAKSLLRRAVVGSPNPIASWFALAMIKTFTADDPDLAAMQRLSEQSSTAPPDVQARLLYALGKAWDDCGEPERAFRHYERGAALRKPAHRYDADSRSCCRGADNWRLHRKVAPAVVPLAGAGSRSLFVTGLPRSGTTLVQQILGAHARVGGGEETNLFGRY